MGDMWSRRIVYAIMLVLTIIGFAVTKDSLFTVMNIILFVGETIMETIKEVHNE